MFHVRQFMIVTFEGKEMYRLKNARIEIKRDTFNKVINVVVS